MLADKEGRRGLELTWIIQEDKHKKSSTYRHGDLQLACAMIAATQLQSFRNNLSKENHGFKSHC